MKLLVVLLIFCAVPFLGWTLDCLVCQNGYHTSTPCSNQLAFRMNETCNGPGSQCFVVVEWFQRGVIQLVRRGCWAPTNQSRPGGYCNNYDRKIGYVKYCYNCTTNNCNNRIIYQPRDNRCTSYN